MSYYFAKTLTAGFDDAVRRTTEALKREGFGIITEIDVKDTRRGKGRSPWLAGIEPPTSNRLAYG
jgi:uncharacterized protein (DUF302 family)